MAVHTILAFIVALVVLPTIQPVAGRSGEPVDDPEACAVYAAVVSHEIRSGDKPLGQIAPVRRRALS